MLKAKNLIPKQRLIVFTIVVVISFITLIGRFFQIQVYQHNIYQTKAEANRIKAVTRNAPRGLIIDRNGKILVDNYPTYVLSCIPIEIEDKDALIKLISKLTGLDSLFLRQNYSKYYRNRFSPTRLAKDLSFQHISVLEEHKSELHGIQITQFPERYYPTQISGTHFLGYVNEVNQNIRGKISGKKQYELGDLIGWHGLEKEYEPELRGDKGVKYIEVDAFGREVGNVDEYKDIPPNPGDNLKLTIDAKLQLLLEGLMSTYQGVAIVSNPKNGDILSYVSSPSHAPDLFTGSVSSETWSNILNNPGRPLVDRVSSGLYPPGSTLKMITALSLLDKKLIDPKWATTCTGSYFYGDRTFRCWNENGHGEVDLRKAIAQSCNVYFYKVVQRLTLTEWSETCKQFGFGKKTGIDLPMEKTGVIPTSDYMNARYGRWGWSKGVMLNVAIGQGDVLVTPLQMLHYINQIATHGNANLLHLVHKKPEEPSRRPVFSSKTWKRIERYLTAVVYDNKGTGKAANPNIKNVIISGKTGTAENPHGEPHAWFVGYGKKENDIVSVAILIENGGHGGETAAPIAREAFRSHFNNSALNIETSNSDY